MFCTDVERYYPSVDRVALEQALVGCRCDEYAVSVVLRFLQRWQIEHNLIGLPIGSDASRVFGNAFLKPVDAAIEAMGVEHLRWMDDILIFGKTTAPCEAALAAANIALNALRLRLSHQKTLTFDDPAKAIAYIEDDLLASLSWLSSNAPGLVQSEVRRAFDREIRGNPNANPKHFRWVLRFLQNRNDSYAATALAQQRDLMNVDPQVTGDYLASVGFATRRVVDENILKLAEPAQDRSDALDLHLLRAAKKHAWVLRRGQCLSQHRDG